MIHLLSGQDEYVKARADLELSSPIFTGVLEQPSLTAPLCSCSYFALFVEPEPDDASPTPICPSSFSLRRGRGGEAKIGMRNSLREGSKEIVKAPPTMVPEQRTELPAIRVVTATSAEPAHHARA